MEEVKKVVKGEKIRNIDEVIREDLARMPASAAPAPAPAPAAAPAPAS